VGYSTEYGLSIIIAGVMVGGNQDSAAFFDNIGEDYNTASSMINIGFNDIAFGINKTTTEQKYLFTVPGWLW
jgi:hypothetical protein